MSKRSRSSPFYNNGRGRMGVGAAALAAAAPAPAAPGGAAAGAAGGGAGRGNYTTRIFGPRGSPSGRVGRNAVDTNIFGDESSLHYAALMDGGLVRNPEADIDPRRRGGRAAPGGAGAGEPSRESMMAAYRRLLPYDGTKHSSSIVLHGVSAVGQSNGLPSEEAEAYMAEGGAMEDALYDAAMTALGHRYQPSTLRIDTHFSTRVAHADRPTAEIDQAMLGGRLVDVPRLHQGSRVATSDESTLRHAIRGYVRDLQGYLDDLPTRASNRTLKSLISSNVWLTPSLSAAHGGFSLALRTARSAAALATETGEVEYEDGVAVLPPSMRLNRGLVIMDSDGYKWNGRCFVLAVMRGLDPYLEATSDVTLPAILLNAMHGAETVVRQVERAHAVAKTRADEAAGKPDYASLLLLVDRRAAELTKATATQTRCRKELETAIASYSFVANRIVRGDSTATLASTAFFKMADGSIKELPAPASRFHASARQKPVEAAAALAFNRTHPLVDFSGPLFKAPLVINQDTVTAIRACISSKVKLQFWTVGAENRLRLAFPDAGATLEWLRASPRHRIVNLLFAHRHIVWIRNVGTACSHNPVVVTEGERKRHVPKGGNKAYCGMCGFAVARTKGRGLSNVFAHQEQGCSKQGGLSLTMPMSPQNVRQLSFTGYKALNRPLLHAVLAVSPLPPDASGIVREAAAALGLWALTPSGYQPLSVEDDATATAWAKWRRANNYVFSRDASVHIPPRGPLVTATDAGGSATLKRPMAALLEILTSAKVVDELWAATHFVGPRAPAAVAAMPKASAATCFACRLPVTEPSTWARQRALMSSSDPAALDEDEDGKPEDEDEDEDDEEEKEKEKEEEDGGAPRDIRICMEEPSSAAAASKAIADAWKPVVHHCHGTGACYWAHADCNTLMRQSANEIFVDVQSKAAMAAAIDVVFSRAFIVPFLHGRLPTLMRSKDGDIRSVSFLVQGTDRALHPAEKEKLALKKKRARAAASASSAAASSSDEDSDSEDATVMKRLRITLRAVSAVLPESRSPVFDVDALTLTGAADASEDAARRCVATSDALLRFHSNAFATTRLWPGAFPTAITYTRNALLASLPPGEFCTSLSSTESFLNVQRMSRGGAIVIGAAPEIPPLADPLDRSKARLYLDLTSNYPVQMTRERYPLPQHEHLDQVVRDFSDHLSEGVHYIATANLFLKKCSRVEVSGYWPIPVQERLRHFPPNFEALLIDGKHLSKWQRKACGISDDSPPTHAMAGHFFPVDGRVLFLRTAALWQRLGFVFSRIGKLYCTPASYWAADFAEALEKRRRAAALAKLDRTLSAAARAAALEDEEDVKFIANSVIGSLNQDVSKFTTLRTVLLSPEGGMGGSAPNRRLTEHERLGTDSSFTGRILSAGDCELYEHGRRSWRHTQQTLAAYFIQEMARCDHLEMWYGAYGNGTLATQRPSIPLVFPGTARVLYGNTDSLVIEVSTRGMSEGGSASAAGFVPEAGSDARIALWRAFNCLARSTSIYSGYLDISNIPLSSTFFSNMTLEQRAIAHTQRLTLAGKWGCAKLEDAGAGLNEVVVNGPNRWGYAVVQSPTDTLPKFAGARACILKSVPKAWRGVATLADFAADLRYKRAAHALEDEDEAVPRPDLFEIAPAPEDRYGPSLGTLVHTARGARRAAIWGNRACRVVLLKSGELAHEPHGLDAVLWAEEKDEEDDKDV